MTVGYETALPLPPAWQDHAACRDMDPALFFPGTGTAGGTIIPPAAVAACAACPVRAECLEFALSNHIRHGFWGGASERQRRRMASQRRRAAA